MIQAKQYDYSKHWDQPVQDQSAVKKVKKTYKKTSYKKRKILLNLTGLAFIYAVVIVFLCIKGATLGYQIVALEKEIKDHETQNARLQYSIQESSSLDKVEEIAINQLNMYKPDRHLSVAFHMPEVVTEDQDQVASNIAEAEKKPLYKIYANLLLLAQKN